MPQNNEMKLPRLKKVFFFIILGILVLILLGGSFTIYWKISNKKNSSLGEQIASDMIKDKGQSLPILKNELELKYNLKQNDNIEVIVIENEPKSPDILIFIYQDPLGPFEVFSLKRNEWFYEE